MTPTHRSSQSGSASKHTDEGPTWGIRDLGEGGKRNVRPSQKKKGRKPTDEEA